MDNKYVPWFSRRGKFLLSPIQWMTVLLVIYTVGLNWYMSKPLSAAIQGQGVFTSCSAVTSTGACTSGQVSNISSRITFTVVVTGAPSAVTLNIEGSIDNTSWFILDTSTTTTSEMRHIANKGIHYLRGNLATLTGGSTPTVTVKLSAGD